MSLEYRQIVGTETKLSNLVSIYECRLAYMVARRRRAASTGASFSMSDRWDGGVRGGKATKSYWPSVSKFVREHNINPFAAYEVLFANKKLFEQAPPPAFLNDLSLVNDYVSASDNALITIKNQLASDTSVVTTRIIVEQSLDGADKTKSVLVVLTQPQLKISPLFKYCLAVSEDLDQLAAKFKKSAMLQYVMYTKEYDKAWEHVLPVSFAGMSAEDRLNALVWLNR